MRIVPLLLLIIFLTGCAFTGRVVEEVEKYPTQQEKDQTNIEKALAEKDVSYCYSTQTQEIREECFMSLAQELGDPSICENLLGSLRYSCEAQIST